MSFVRSGRRDMFRSAAELRQQGRVPNTLFRVRRPIHPFIDVNRIKKQSVTRTGICISPAGEERLPAGLAPAKSLQGCAMSKRRGRRRTRKAIKAQNRGHLAMSRSRNTGPRPRHDVNSSFPRTRYPPYLPSSILSSYTRTYVPFLDIFFICRYDGYVKILSIRM